MKQEKNQTSNDTEDNSQYIEKRPSEEQLQEAYLQSVASKSRNNMMYLHKSYNSNYNSKSSLKLNTESAEKEN